MSSKEYEFFVDAKWIALSKEEIILNLRSGVINTSTLVKHEGNQVRFTQIKELMKLWRSTPQPISSSRYNIHEFRCNGCGKVFTENEYKSLVNSLCPECNDIVESKILSKIVQKVVENPVTDSKSRNISLITCGSCSHKYSPRADKCPKCGTSPSATCQVCSRQIPNNSETCPECGDPEPFSKGKSNASQLENGLVAHTKSPDSSVSPATGQRDLEKKSTMSNALRWIFAAVGWLVLIVIYALWKIMDRHTGGGFISGFIRGFIFFGGVYGLYRWAKGAYRKIDR